MGRGEDDPPKVEKEGIKMKTMARKRLSGLIRLSLAFIVALTLAAPYTSAAAYANELITNTLRNTDIDLVAYSSDAKASLSLDEAKAALDSANQNKADAAASKDEAQKALDEATAQYNEAESAHSDAAQAANAAKAEADKAVGDAISAKEAEVAAAEARYQETYDALVAAQKNEKEARDNLKKAQTDYQAARGEFDSAVKDMNNYNLSQSVSDLTQAEKEYNAAALKHSELMDAYQAATKERDKAYAAYQSASSKVDSADKAVTSADSKVAQAKEALAAAQARLDAAEEADGAERERLQGLVNEARTNLTAAQTQRSTAQGNLDSARSAQASAQTVYDDAVAALEAAKKAAEGAGADLDALKQAAADAKEKSNQAESNYNTEAEKVGNPGSYTDAEAALTQAQQEYAAAQQNTQSALQEWNDAKDALAAIKGDSGTDPGEVTDPELAGGGDPSELDSSDASSSEIGPAATEQEIADAEQRVVNAEADYNSKVQIENEKLIACNEAQTRFDNASSIRSLEDAKNAAAAEYQAAYQAYQNALNGSSSVDLSSYEQAVRDAEADLNTASGEVTSLENQIAVMDKNISSLEVALEQAQENLDNYGGSDHSVLEQAVADCNAEWVDAQAELNKANADLTAAQSEKTQADTIYRAKNDAVEAALREEKTFREGELARANEAKKNATTAYTNALNGITDDSLKDTPYEGTPAAQVVRNIKALKNKADALDKEVIRYQAAIPGLGVKIEEANAVMAEAGQQHQYAKAALERAKALDIEDIINNPKDEGTEFFALNEFANKLAAAREQEKPFAEQHEAARMNLENARNSFATASAELDRTTAEAAAAQKVYDDLLAQQDNNGGSKDPDVYTPSKKPAAKPATKPAASNGKATVRTADDKTPAKDEAVAEQSDEQTAEEAVVTVSQEQRTPVQPKAWTFFGIDPLIVGIVGAAILVAAAAAIAAAVIRHRRIAAEVVESDE